MYNFYKTPLLFLIGVLIGSFLAICVHFNQNYKNNTHSPGKEKTFSSFLMPAAIHNSTYDQWFEAQGLSRSIDTIDNIRYSRRNRKSEADFLRARIKILCVILSNNDNTSNAAIQTWAKGCDNITVIRFGEKKLLKLPPFRTNIKADSRWGILCNELRQMHFRTVEQFHWTLVVNEQTFVLMENLRWFVAGLDHEDEHYLGQADTFWGVKYNSASAGYVLSKGILKLLWNEFQMNKCTAVSLQLNKEDFTLGTILSRRGIFPADTRDVHGYSTFNTYNWQQEFFPGLNYYKNSIYPHKCCSSRVITFKGIEHDKFYMYHYLLYHLDVFATGDLGNRPLAAPRDKDYVWKSWLVQHGIHHNVSAEEYYRLWEESGMKLDMFVPVDANYN